MVVYHFTTSEFALKALRDRRLKIARINELNDPFEFCADGFSDINLKPNWKHSRIRRMSAMV